jgi:methionine aminopeptidase
MARSKSDLPTIVDVPEMPRRRRGRTGADIAPLVDALRDRRAHAIEDVSNEEQRRKWRRRLRRAAKQEGLRVETGYVGHERRLYFRGTDTRQAS